METTKSIPEAGEIFGQSLRIYKARFGQFLLLSMLTFLPFEAIRVFGVTSVSKEIWFIILEIVAVVLLLTGQIGMYFLAGDSSLTVSGAFRKGLSSFFPYILTAILLGLAVLPAYALLLIPGVILSIWFCVTTPVVLFERLSGAAAMARSREYVRGRWWSVFWRMFVIGVFAGVLGGISNAIKKHDVILGEALATIISVLILPITTVYLVELYAHLRATRPEIHHNNSLKIWIWILGVIGILGLLGLGWYVFGSAARM